MNSEIINFVAGGGKTTYSYDYMLKNKSGLYLAFTNSVVNEMKGSGILSLTINSLFTSFIIPKMLSYMPIIASGSKITHNDKSSQGLIILGAIKIAEDGTMFNKSKVIASTLQTANADLHATDFKSASLVKNIFGVNSIRLDHEQSSALSSYVLVNYPDEVLSLIRQRFKYIIIDEAQDIKSGFLQKFAEILFNSDIKLLLLGDPYQNVNNGSDWFGDLVPTKTEYKSHRCPEGVCRWIRDNLGIEIHGKDSSGNLTKIKFEIAHKYDNGARTLLYSGSAGAAKNIVDSWKGPKNTIKSAKGSTIDGDIVVLGKSLNINNIYTAITRTTKNVYSTIDKVDTKKV